jgi:hypothetical protein
MPALTVEERIATLEQEVARLHAKVAASPELDVPWLDRIYGAFRGNRVFKEAMELGRKYRESLRPKRKKRKKAGGRS